VCAAPEGKVLLGYFFGPRLESKTPVELDDLDPAKALLRVRFGDLGLINGEWPVLGTIPEWNPAQWPMPWFVQRDPLGKMKPKLVRYSDRDPNHEESEEPVDNDSGLEPDSRYGSGAVEIRLAKLLGRTQNKS
jgi:hypothetical protein